jgi:hypothetical protein
MHRYACINSGGESCGKSIRCLCKPDIASWHELYGDGLDNETMRSLLNSFDYGSATLPITDSNFLSNLNEFKPESYPEFTEASVLASQL